MRFGHSLGIVERTMSVVLKGGVVQVLDLMVPVGGVEPPHPLGALDFESVPSADSTGRHPTETGNIAELAYALPVGVCCCRVLSVHNCFTPAPAGAGASARIRVR